MREKIASLLLLISLFLIIGIDITPMFIGDSQILLSTKLSYFESLVDATAVILTYWLLKRELNFRTKVLNMAAHDLRNPLGIIRGYAELILEKRASPESERHMLRRIVAQSDEMLTLVSDLLDSSVLENHSVKLERAPCYFNSLVHESIESFRDAALLKNQNFTVRDDGELRVNADAARMKQVLNNLLSNAVKYSPPGAAIDIALRGTADRARLSICDQGPGLSLEESERIFDSFSKVKKQTTGGERSTGIGLSIARSLVKLNGGEIWVESSGEGLGSTFIVELPLHTEVGSVADFGKRGSIPE